MNNIYFDRIMYTAEKMDRDRHFNKQVALNHIKEGKRDAEVMFKTYLDAAVDKTRRDK